MKKLISCLLAFVILLSLIPAASASEGAFGWNGDSSDFGCWELTDISNVTVNPGEAGTRRVWRSVVTDTSNFSVTLTCAVLTGRAYISLMGAIVELNRDGGGADYLFTNVDRQWFYAKDYTAAVTFSRYNGGPMTVRISGKNGSSDITKDYNVSSTAKGTLYLGTYEQTASASFTGIRSVGGRSSDWTALSNYWNFDAVGAAACDNPGGTAALLGTSRYFTGAFTLSYRLDFTKFYMENRIGSVRVGLCSSLTDGTAVLFDIMAENNGKNTFALSYWQDETWNSCGSEPWNDGDAGRYDNSFYVQLSRSAADAPIVFTLFRSDKTTVAGSPLTLEGMKLSSVDALHAIRMEFYNCACVCSEFSLSVTAGGAEISGWDADTAAFSAYGSSGLIALGSGKTAYLRKQISGSDTWYAFINCSFGSGEEVRKLLLTDSDRNELYTAVVRKTADGTARMTLERDGAQVQTVPASLEVPGMNNQNAVLRITKTQGHNRLLLSFAGDGATTAELTDLDRVAGMAVSSSTASVIYDAGILAYGQTSPLTEEQQAAADLGDGVITPDIPFSEAALAYNNLIKNYLDTAGNRLYPVEGGYRNGYVLPDGRTVTVNKAGELWESYILLSAMETYSKLLPEGSAEQNAVLRRIANTVNFFADSYTEAELTTAGTSPCNHAMDDSGWCDAALILGYRCNLVLGDTERAQQLLDYAVKLFHSIYDVFYDDCLGGGTWYNRSAVSKSLYAAMAALDGWDLLQITGDSRIEREMTDIYNGIENNLRRDDGIYWCGLRYTGEEGIGNPNGINEGGSVSFLGCNMAMAVMNARLGNLEKAKQTAAGMTLRQTTENGTYLNDRDAWVNAVFAGRWAEELLKTGILPAAYAETLRRTASAILQNSCLEDGWYSPSWVGPCEPSPDGYPADWEGEMNRWGKAGNGTVPRQMMTSATTAHMIIAAAMLSETPATSPAAFGWHTDSEDYSGWLAGDRWNLTGYYVNQQNHRLWTAALPETGAFTLTADVTVDAESSAYLRMRGVTLELDGRHGTGHQAYVKLAGSGLDWLETADGAVHIALTATAEGCEITLTGSGNETPMALTCLWTEQSENLEIGLFAGTAQFRNITVLLPECPHEYAPDETKSVPAACLTAGKTVYICAKCGDAYEETLPALGHDYVNHAGKPATCLESGWELYQTCARCGYSSYTEIAAPGHDYRSEITKEPTEDAEGELTLTCARCGDTCTEPLARKECPLKDYTDTDTSKWYHSAADFVVENGYMGSTKTDALTFEPNTKVSRAMVASILYRIAETPAVEYSGAFADVKAGKWFTNAIEWAAQNGLAAGRGDGRFDPNGNVTRQELAVFMYKLAEFLGRDVSGAADLSGFPDARTVPAWAKDYVNWAVSAGLISGKGQKDGSILLAPKDNAARAEFASIIMRFMAG